MANNPLKVYNIQFFLLQQPRRELGAGKQSLNLDLQNRLIDARVIPLIARDLVAYLKKNLRMALDGG